MGTQAHWVGSLLQLLWISEKPEIVSTELVPIWPVIPALDAVCLQLLTAKYGTCFDISHYIVLA